MQLSAAILLVHLQVRALGQHQEKKKCMPETWKHHKKSLAPYFCVVYTLISIIMALKIQEMAGNAQQS